jgi:hypothetical protein
VSTRFKPFGNNDIHSGCFRFFGKQRTGNYMSDHNSFVFQPACPFFRTSGGSKHNFYILPDNDFHNFINFRIEERHIHTKGFVGCRFCFQNVLFKSGRMHGAGTNQPKPSRIADSRCQPPA